MPWRFTRPAVLARRHFTAGDPLPSWLSDGAMIRYLTANWPGLLRDDAAGSPAPPTQPPAPPDEDAAWAEWAEMRERLEPFRGGEDEEALDGEVR